jgi:hypothetical protein
MDSKSSRCHSARVLDGLAHVVFRRKISCAGLLHFLLVHSCAFRRCWCHGQDVGPNVQIAQIVSHCRSRVMNAAQFAVWPNHWAAM